MVSSLLYPAKAFDILSNEDNVPKHHQSRNRKIANTHHHRRAYARRSFYRSLNRSNHRLKQIAVFGQLCLTAKDADIVLLHAIAEHFGKGA